MGLLTASHLCLALRKRGQWPMTAEQRKNRYAAGMVLAVLRVYKTLPAVETHQGTQRECADVSGLAELGGIEAAVQEALVAGTLRADAQETQVRRKRGYDVVDDAIV